MLQAIFPSFSDGANRVTIEPVPGRRKMCGPENRWPFEPISILKDVSGNAQEVMMLDRLLKSINQKLDTHTAAAVAQRAKIERERAGDVARQHAGREFENSEGYTTPLPKAAQQAQNAYARSRRDFEANGGASALTLAITMMIARERRDETAAALKRHEEAEARRRAVGVHKEVEPFFDLMFDHGVEPRHLVNVRPETLAIICDLIRWDGHDPELVDPASPMPPIFGLYSNRTILKPGQFGDKSRSAATAPVRPIRRSDPQCYMFGDLVAGSDEAVPSELVPAAVSEHQEEGALSAETLPEEAAAADSLREVAEKLHDADPIKVDIYWPRGGYPIGDFTPERLIPALEQWIADDAWPGARDFLEAARRGEARQFIDHIREEAIGRIAAALMDGDPGTVERARSAGLAV